MIHLGIRFLTDAYRFGSSPNTSGHHRPWPPSPDQLFQALVAAHYSLPTDSDAFSTEEKLLHTLAKCKPTMTVPHLLGEGLAYQIAVPPNFLVKRPSLQRAPSDITWKAAEFVSEPLYFHWDLQLSEKEQHVLQVLLARVGSLGAASSLVLASLEAEAPEPNWIPTSTVGERYLECPAPGRLEELQKLFTTGSRGLEGAEILLVGYRASQTTDSSLSAVSKAPLSTFLFLDRRAGPAWDPRAAYPLAHQLRRAILQRWGQVAPDIPTWVLGHGAGPHTPRLSIWPLFHVGFPYADGHAMGFLLAWPSTLPTSEQQTMQRVARQITKLGHNGRRWVLQVRDPREPQFSPLPKGLTLERWTKPSRVWTTVTPVILDRAPKANRSHDAWSRLFANAGIPEPVQIDAHAIPRLEGSVPVRHTILPSHYRPRPITTHLTCVFEEPIAGPLALGRGRFLGLGLLAPLPDCKE